MNNLKKIFVATVAAIVVVGFLPQQAFADPLGTMTNYTTQHDPGSYQTEGANGTIWSSKPNSFIIFDKNTQQTNTLAGPADGAENLTFGPDGNIWYSYHQSLGGIGKVGKITPNGTRTEYTIPQEMTGDTQPAYTLAAGPDGRLWLHRLTLVQIVSGNGIYKRSLLILNTDGSLYKRIKYGANYVDHVNRPFRLIPSRTDNTLWEFSLTQTGSTIGNHISKIDLHGNRTEKNVTFGNSSTKIWDVELGPDGDLWFVANSEDLNTTYIGKTFEGSNGWDFIISKLPSTVSPGSGQIIAGQDGNMWLTHGRTISQLRLSRIQPAGIIGNEDEIPTQHFYSIAAPPGILAGSDNGNIWQASSFKYFKVGTGEDSSTVDNDGDGLDLARESSQHTSDGIDDSDSDGLSDYTESQWNPNRNALFCNSTATTCEYPNPTQKDLYVEIDWMHRPTEGPIQGYDTKPSTSQIQNLVDAYAAKSIRAHFDTGQLGGGNEVEYHREVAFHPDPLDIDFQDYKKGNSILGWSAQFNSDRQGIYHYILSGYSYSEDTDSSGISYVSDDDSFIAYGFLRDPGNINFGTTISGTIIHELGHSLCLAQTSTQAGCGFSGIDTHAGNGYPSAMNYNEQYTRIDYSMGENGSGDHDDWSALRLQDFATSTHGDLAHGTAIALQKKFKNNHSSMKKTIEYKKFLKEIERLQRKVQHHH